MDKNTDYNKKYFQSISKKRQLAIKSVNNYISQLKMHFELSNDEIFDILNSVNAQYKKNMSIKKWWIFFK